MRRCRQPRCVHIMSFIWRITHVRIQRLKQPIDSMWSTSIQFSTSLFTTFPPKWFLCWRIRFRETFTLSKTMIIMTNYSNTSLSNGQCVVGSLANVDVVGCIPRVFCNSWLWHSRYTLQHAAFHCERQTENRCRNQMKMKYKATANAGGIDNYSVRSYAVCECHLYINNSNCATTKTICFVPHNSDGNTENVKCCRSFVFSSEQIAFHSFKFSSKYFRNYIFQEYITHSVHTKYYAHYDQLDDGKPCFSRIPLVAAKFPLC